MDSMGPDHGVLLSEWKEKGSLISHVAGDILPLLVSANGKLTVCSTSRINDTLLNL